uniref:protein-serine/threonine phosphatase n=1 Tax=Meloidogyne javanica TaxID=6303 RepID=A0A915LGL3_MELJA
MPSTTINLQLVRRIASWILKYNHLNGITDIEIAELIDNCQSIIEQEPSFIRVKAPVIIFSDIHGNFVDLLEFFRLLVPDLLSLGDPKVKCTLPNLLFLGDYVDRGAQSLEVITFLVCLKTLFPKRITLLHGNHESADINKRNSFYNDVISKRNGNFDIWAHGGLPRIKYWNELAQVKKPKKVSDCYNDYDDINTVVNDLLWADPTNNLDPNNGVNSWFNDDRQTSIKYNDLYIREFMNRFPHIKGVVRGHEHVNSGYKLNADRTMCTLFTAPRYDRRTDSGCVMKISSDLKVSFIRLTPPDPPNSSALEDPPTPRTTGAITLNGGLKAVGGLKWKLEAAAGMGKSIILLPTQMEKEFYNLTVEERMGFTAICSDNFGDLFETIFGPEK